MSITNIVALQFITGRVFFLGLGLACAGFIAPTNPETKIVSALRRLSTILGMILVVMSGTPLQLWWYFIWFVAVFVAWRGGAKFKNRRVAVAPLLFVSLAMAALEAPYHLPVSIDASNAGALYVVGDSLSIGADPPGKNWPDLLVSRTGLTVYTFAFGGEKASTALANAKRIDDPDAIVVLEIGGNDVLYDTEDFEKSLNEVLDAVCNGKRKVIMFELPLPPFYNRYGVAQRKLARTYRVTLIPKAYLAEIVMTPGATVDNLHLSNSGHELLADAVAGMLRI